MNKHKEILENELAFAELGKQVINNEAYQQAITIRKAQIFEVFCSTSADQSDVRDEAWRTMKNMNALEDYLKQALTTGNMAEKSLESMNSE